MLLLVLWFASDGLVGRCPNRWMMKSNLDADGLKILMFTHGRNCFVQPAARADSFPRRWRLMDCWHWWRMCHYILVEKTCHKQNCIVAKGFSLQRGMGQVEEALLLNHHVACVRLLGCTSVLFLAP